MRQMSKHEVIVRCWNHGHETKEFMTRRQEEKLVLNIDNNIVVCPICKSPLLLVQGSSIFHASGHKLLNCEHDHITTVSAFSNMLHLRFGIGNEDYINIEGSPQELQDLLDTREIVCYHKIGEQSCSGNLKAIDNTPLEMPKAAGIKTKTRVGDVWDKAHIEPVRSGSYDNDGNYNDSKTDKANRERLKRIRKNRNIPVDKHPGTRIDRSTDITHDRRTKDSIDFS